MKPKHKTMKIYKVLKDCNPFLTEGTVKESSLKNHFTEGGIKYLLCNNYIKAPKPKWTDDDMKEFAVAWMNADSNISVNDYFDKFKIERS